MPVKLRMTYSIAALRLNASMSAVCFSTKELPTERTSIPSVVEPTWIINMYMYVYIYIYTRTHTHAHTHTHTHRQLGVFAHALFDDVSDVLHGGPEVLHPIVAQRYIVGKLGLAVHSEKLMP